MSVGVVLAVIFTLGWVPLFVFRAEAMSEALPSYRGGERLWVWLAPVMLSVHVSAGCIAVSFTRAIPPWRIALALAVFGSGVAVWFWGRAQIGPLRLRRLPDEPPLRLRRDGAFGLVRNPLYLGYLLAASAPVIVTGSLFLLATLTLCVIALAVRSLQEERRLRAQLGREYEAYQRQVKRLVPFVW